MNKNILKNLSLLLLCSTFSQNAYAMLSPTKEKPRDHIAEEVNKIPAEEIDQNIEATQKKLSHYKTNLRQLRNAAYLGDFAGDNKGYEDAVSSVEATIYELEYKLKLLRAKQG